MPMHTCTNTYTGGGPRAPVRDTEATDRSFNLWVAKTRSALGVITGRLFGVPGQCGLGYRSSHWRSKSSERATSTRLRAESHDLGHPSTETLRTRPVPKPSR